jgi:hypothetical protein
MEVSNSAVRGGGRSKGRSWGGDEILPSVFRLRVGARTISMVAQARAGVDRFSCVETETRLALEKRPIQAFALDLAWRCFDARATSKAATQRQPSHRISPFFAL